MKNTALTLTIATMAGFISIQNEVWSAPLSLSNIPLFVSQPVDPNVFIELDDSGSMDWEILTPPHPSAANSNFTVTVGLMYEGGNNYEYYLYNNADNAYNFGNNPDFFALNDWRARCSCLNVLAYNPSITYKPWPGFPNADIAAARSNPQPGTAGHTMLRDLRNDVYFTWNDANNDKIVQFSEQGIEYHVNNLNATQQQNYANWYQYYRRRSFVAKGAIANVIQANPGYRYGLSVINDWQNLFVEVPSSPPYGSHNSNLLAKLFSFQWPPFGTPLRSALDRTGQYFDHTLQGKADPIQFSCQKNFTVLFTDGFWNGSSPNLGDLDGDGVSSNGDSTTLADVAYRYYDADLSPLPDEVLADAFDTNTRQHMVTYTVAFGVKSNLTDTDGDGWPNPPLTEASDWGNPFNSNPAKINDLWHTAYNGKGIFVSASTPKQVAEGLEEALSNIENRIGSAASVALNTGSISNNSYLYQPRFNTTDWSGELIARNINNDGTLGSIAWDASCILTGGTCSIDGQTYAGTDWNTGREIITFKKSTGKGIKFRWPVDENNPTASELDIDQINALNQNAETGIQDALGQKRLNFIRGKSISGFRNRSSLLGDFIHSSPIYVGKPEFNYPDNLEAKPYSTFFINHKNRTPMIYIGANDGMLHAFDGSNNINSGHEKLAYVPDEVFDHLNKLTSKEYGRTIPHQYYIDGELTAGDVFFNNNWHTVLVGSLRAGGQGIFALDITNPSNFSENNADSIVLWEFTDEDDTDLGFTFSQPAIVKMNNDRWAAVFGNGYNSTENDSHTSSTGNAVLYVVDIETGYLIKKFDTGVGSADDPSNANRPNGLSTPAPIDIDGDYKIDYIYVGDLFGNLWKIDVSAHDVASWGFSYMNGSNPKPLYQAKDGNGNSQPITVRPDVGQHPFYDGVMIYFGTGKYLENTIDNDASGAQTQTFYAIWDKNDSSLNLTERASFGRSHLLKQCIIKQINLFGKELRTTTNYSIKWHTGSGLSSAGVKTKPSYCPSPSDNATHLGWYIDLINIDMGNNTNNKGEKQVTYPILKDEKIIFTTLLPSNNPCKFGGTGWLMELDAFDGSRLEFSPFDLNGDGKFNNNDFVNVGDLDNDGKADTIPVSGIKSTVGILSKPAIMEDSTPKKEYKYLSGSQGTIEQLQENRGTGSRRLSWRQLR